MNSRLVAIISILFLFLACCSKDSSSPCGDCPEGTTCCNEPLGCYECCADGDCPDSPAAVGCTEEFLICNEDRRCDCVCYREGNDCSRDLSACCGGLSCDVFTNTCMTECTADSDCGARVEIPFVDDMLCENGLCDFMHCKKDADCAGGKLCYNGDCVTMPLCDQLDRCVVLPASAVTKQGTTASFAAIPYLRSGALAPGYILAWSSSDPNIASVDAGLVTGGANTGIAEIAASPGGCENIRCGATVLNYGGKMTGTRVVVVDELEGTPIDGATVEVGAESVVTDEYGVAALDVELSPANPMDVLVLKREYDYKTLETVESSDVLVHLWRIHELDFGTDPPTEVAGGIRGSFDLTKIRREPGFELYMYIGFAGLSIPGNLFNLNLKQFIGEMVRTVMKLGGSEEELLLPSGMIECLDQACFRSVFHNMGVRGKRIAWGISGRVDMSIIYSLVADDPNPLVFYLSKLEIPHSDIVPNVDVVPVPKVVDILDANGNESNVDLIPESGKFERVDLAAKVAMDQTITVTVPPLPPTGGEGYHYDSVIVLPGVVVKGSGFVPLGIASGVDQAYGGDINGVLEEPIEVKVADVAGRLPEGTYRRVLLAVALDYAEFESREGVQAVAGQVRFLDDFSGTVELDEFMPPAVVEYDAVDRTLDVASVPPEADYVQAVFHSENDLGRWLVLDESWDGTFQVPTESTYWDRSSHATFVAVDLKDGVSYQDILEFNSTNMDNLVELVQAFVYVDDANSPNCADCSTGGAGGLLFVWMLLGLAWLRRSSFFAALSLLMVLFASCGGDGRTNCSENGIEDCREGEECLYSGNREDDFYCLRRCTTKDDCPSGQDCTGSAASCMTCMDYIRVCE